jgi:hypothetical protein
MNKFLISTPGRTASSSFFNYIEKSLNEISTDVAAIDRGQYTGQEWAAFNSSEYAALTTFNPFHFPNILDTIDPSKWCLLLLSRKDFASWLLSINTLNATNQWHPGKEHTITDIKFEQDAFMSSYWYYKCWQRLIYDRADTYGFGQVVYIDFEDLTTNWVAVGRSLGWTWDHDPKMMKMGATVTWADISNIDEVLTWIPDSVILNDIKKVL